MRGTVNLNPRRADVHVKGRKVADEVTSLIASKAEEFHAACLVNRHRAKQFAAAVFGLLDTQFFLLPPADRNAVEAAIDASRDKDACTRIARRWLRKRLVTGLHIRALATQNKHPMALAENERVASNYMTVDALRPGYQLFVKKYRRWGVSRAQLEAVLAKCAQQSGSTQFEGQCVQRLVDAACLQLKRKQCENMHKTIGAALQDDRPGAAPR